jgi:outer membrane protein assembly factor BamB
MKRTVLLSLFLSFLSNLAAIDGVVVVVDDGRVPIERLLLGATTGSKPKKLFIQAANPIRADRVRAAVGDALGREVFVDYQSDGEIGFADNVADRIVCHDPKVKRAEIDRVLHPGGIGKLFVRSQYIDFVASSPEGMDDWSHPYHGPDNNPNSDDQLVRGEFRTQFLGFPMFSPMPQQSVSAGGIVFKAFGHIAHKANQNAVLNTLMAVNGYNGTILWQRPLPKGFMIHRNTMIATKDALYMGDHESCKVFDAQTGALRDEYLAPKGVTDGPVWKWMALKDGVLYALIGGAEVQVDTQQSNHEGLGHWPWGMWKGHDYKDPKSAFGFGRTVVAIDVETKKLLWYSRQEEYLDARALAMNGDSIFCYSPEKVLLRLNSSDGKLVWRSDDKEMLKAIDGNLIAQHYTTGYSTSCYLKCNNDYLFFAGPQRRRLVVVSAEDGKVSWTRSPGNLQLVLRDDALYAAGPQRELGAILDYASGKVLKELPGRRACTRATGCADSVFFRASGGTVRLMTESGQAQHIDPMRPPCQDGVLIANGHLYWGPWMCGCQLSLYGNICLGPAGQQPLFLNPKKNIHAGALQQFAGFRSVAKLNVNVAKPDWPSYRGGNARNDVAATPISDEVDKRWSAQVVTSSLPTAPVVAGGLIFVADRAGAVQAFNQQGKQVWKSYTGGAVYYPPTIAHDRAYVGSADGRVHAFEAKTGRRLWTFRVGPAPRRIPVYGKLISTWPVSGGVIFHDGRVYAAAGIAHYDGTYVVALDAKTGRLLAANTSSGVVGEASKNGISVQGVPRIEDGELRFLAGGVYETARYDLKTLKCLNGPREQITAQFRTAFYPFFPEYGKYVSLEYKCEDGCTLNHDASYEGSRFTSLTLQEPPPKGVTLQKKEAARWLLPRNLGKDKKPLVKSVWRDRGNRRFTSFVVSGDRLLAAGHSGGEERENFLAAIDVESGKDIWSHELPSTPVKGGTALDSAGRIYVTMENGQLVGYQP